MNLRHPLFALACLVLLAPSPSAAFDLLGYQADGWRYRQVAPGDPLEGTFMQAGFDDSGWAVGQASFGSGTGCPLDGNDHTPWALNTAILLRHPFPADPASPVTVVFSVDNDATVWVNGQRLGSVVHEGCPTTDDWSFDVPPGFLHAGTNEVCVRALDRGGVSYVDLRIQGELPVPALARTWGRLKAVYR